MSYCEEDLLPVSALQHLVFCERQCALNLVEQAWTDNALTLEGSHMHRRADETGARREMRGDMIVTRGLALRSLRLGLSGRADVVEFRRVSPPSDSTAELADMAAGIPLPAASGSWIPFPVDYKHGRPKPDRSDEVQLCAQALCLEEMLRVAVPCGALFYGKTQRRHNVNFDVRLKELTETTTARLHQLIASGVTPRAVREPKCERCSLLERCLPEAMSSRRSASRYLEAAVAESLAEKKSIG